MTNDALTLQQIAQLAVDRNGGAGGRALDRIAKAKGLTLSYTTVDKILAGNYRSTPKTSTLEALAVLAGVAREQVYKAADRPLPQASLAEQLPEGADSLTPQQREVVLGLVRQFVQANRILTSARNVVAHGAKESALDQLVVMADLLRNEPPRDGVEIFYDQHGIRIEWGGDVPTEDALAEELAHGPFFMPPEPPHDDTTDDPRLHYINERETRRRAAEAARTTGKPSAGQKRRAEADQAGEPPADDPDDVEPR